MKQKLLSSIFLFGLLTGKTLAVDFTFCCEDKHVFPFFIGNSEKVEKDPGVSIELLQSLEKDIPGLNVKITRAPWKRCQVMMKSGEADSVIASYKKEREVWANYPKKGDEVDGLRRLSISAYSLYVTKDSPLSFDGKTFQGIKKGVMIGIPAGYSVKWFLKKKEVPFEETQDTYANFQKLLANRIQGVATLELLGDYYLKNKPFQFKDVKKIPTRLQGKNYYLVFSKSFVSNHKDVSDKIWGMMDQIRQRREVILHKYLSK